MTTTVSGYAAALSLDELRVLDDYRQVRSEGHGALFVEFSQHRITKYVVTLAGRVQLMNGLLPSRRE